MRSHSYKVRKDHCFKVPNAEVPKGDYIPTTEEDDDSSLLESIAIEEPPHGEVPIDNHGEEPSIPDEVPPQIPEELLPTQPVPEQRPAPTVVSTQPETLAVPARTRPVRTKKQPRKLDDFIVYRKIYYNSSM